MKKKIINKMSVHRDWLLWELIFWQEIFDNDGDEPGYNELTRLIDLVKNHYKKLTHKDWDNIIFHLWQQKGQD